MLTKVYGQAEANRLLKIEFDAIAQRRSEVFNYQADQSTNPKSFDPPASFLTLQRNELIPQMNGQYANLMRKVKIAQEKAAIRGLSFGEPMPMAPASAPSPSRTT